MTLRVSDLRAANKEALWYLSLKSLRRSLERRAQWLASNGHYQPTHAILLARAYRLIDACLRLDAYTVIPPVLRWTAQEWQDICFPGAPPIARAKMSLKDEAVCRVMKRQTQNALAHQHKQMLQYEIAYRCKQGWYLIFNTLTVDAQNYEDCFAAGSRYFDRYIKRVAKACGGVENHKYFAVVEEGSKNGRLHLHVLHMCAKLPKGVQDPNAGLRRPYRREIDAMRKYWPAGNSTPIAVRYSSTDAYSKANWRWPLGKDGLPEKMKGPQAVGGYVGKYITKAYKSPKRNEFKWRIKKTQKLGVALLEEILTTLTSDQLLWIAENENHNLYLNKKAIPQNKLRSLCLKRLQNAPCSNSPLVSLLEWAKEASPRPSLLQRSRASIPTKTQSSLQKTTYFMTDPISNMDVSSYDLIARSVRTIDAKYFRADQRFNARSSSRDAA